MHLLAQLIGLRLYQLYKTSPVFSGFLYTPSPCRSVSEMISEHSNRITSLTRWIQSSIGLCNNTYTNQFIHLRDPSAFIHSHASFMCYFVRVQCRFSFAMLCKKKKKLRQFTNIHFVSADITFETSISSAVCDPSSHGTSLLNSPWALHERRTCALSPISPLHTGHDKSLRIIPFLYLSLRCDIGDIPNLK